MAYCGGKKAHMGGVEGVNINTPRICTEDMQGNYGTDTYRNGTSYPATKRKPTRTMVRMNGIGLNQYASE
jgi:hypothetical protein